MPAPNQPRLRVGVPLEQSAAHLGDPSRQPVLASPCAAARFVSCSANRSVSREDPSAGCRQPQFGECWMGQTIALGGHAQDLGSGGGLVGAG